MTPKSMMPANQGDTVKVAGLLGAIALVAVFSFWRIKSAGPQPQNQPAIENPAAAAVLAPPPKAVADEEMVQLPLASPPGVENPFRQVLASAVPAPASKPKPVKPAHKPRSAVTAYLVRPESLPGVFETRGAGQSEDVPKLKGILSRGVQGVAVLSVGNKDFTVRAGDHVGDGYVVWGVNGRQVVLHKGQLTRVLRIDD